MVWVVIHLLICCCIGLLMYTKKLKVEYEMIVVVLCVPVVGVILLLEELMIEQVRLQASKEIDMEYMKVEDAIFRQIPIEQKQKEQFVVPFEEAMIVNDAKLSRSLLMDVLQRDPEEHIDLLQSARLSDDTELTHYASTTMMEIQGGFEQRIRELEAEQQMHSEDGKVLRKLRYELEEYINSGLLSGNILKIYRQKLLGVLENLCARDTDNQNYQLDYIEQLMECKDYLKAEECIKQFLKQWPMQEQGMKKLVSLYHLTNQTELLQQVLLEITEREIYLTSEGKEWLSFWMNEH